MLTTARPSQRPISAHAEGSSSSSAALPNRRRMALPLASASRHPCPPQWQEGPPRWAGQST